MLPGYSLTTQAKSNLQPINTNTMPPNSSALLSSQVPLFTPTKMPTPLKTSVLSPIIAQATNGFTSSMVSVKPAAKASILVATCLLYTSDAADE